MKFVHASFWLVILGIALLSRIDQAAAQKPPTKMTASYSAAGGQYINLFVAKEFGIFEKHGLDVTLNQINSRDRKSTRLNSSHIQKSRMPSSA